MAFRDPMATPLLEAAATPTDPTLLRVISHFALTSQLAFATSLPLNIFPTLRTVGATAAVIEVVAVAAVVVGEVEEADGGNPSNLGSVPLSQTQWAI